MTGETYLVEGRRARRRNLKTIKEHLPTKNVVTRPKRSNLFGTHTYDHVAGHESKQRILFCCLFLSNFFIASLRLDNSVPDCISDGISHLLAPITGELGVEIVKYKSVEPVSPSNALDQISFDLHRYSPTINRTQQPAKVRTAFEFHLGIIRISLEFHEEAVFLGIIFTVAYHSRHS